MKKVRPIQLYWHRVEEIGSTNTALKAMGLSGAPEGTVLQAVRQTGGKGRMGRSFFSPAGGVYVSLLLRSVPYSPLLTVAAATAAAEAAEALTGRPVGIKWVNDLIFEGKKVCGILAERVTAPEGDFTVVGFGVNLAPPPGGFPPEIREIAGALLPAAPAGGADRLARDMIERFADYAADLPGRGFLPGYRARSVLTGRTVIYRQAGEERSAEVLGIDGDGGLLVKTEKGEETLHSGEVTLHGGFYGRT